MVLCKGKRTECDKVKKMFWSQFGKLSDQEIGRIVKVAFPGVKRGKHCSGYKYYYYGLVTKTTVDTDCLVPINSISSGTTLTKENDMLRKQVEAACKQNDDVKQELQRTKHDLIEVKEQLQYQRCHGSHRTNRSINPHSPSCTITVTDFTPIPSEFLIEVDMATNKVPKHIGSGAFGVCVLKLYRNIEVAIKYLKGSSFQDLLSEAKIIKELQGHPNLPILLGISPKTTKERYIVTKFHGKNLKGISLCYALKNKLADIEIKQYQCICHGVAKGLLHMHIRGYLHNDLKPDNVVIDFIEGKPSPVIIDFGKSCTVSEGKTKKVPLGERQMYLKKHSHIAPELLDGVHRQAISTDIYSLGILLRLVNQRLRSCDNNKGTTVIGDLADKCTLNIPFARPNMDTVVEELKSY